jgi:hypothetical protein
VSDAGFIIGAYVLVAVVMALAAFIVITRGRRLAGQVPDEDKPWT